MNEDKKSTSFGGSWLVSTGSFLHNDMDVDVHLE